MINGQKVIKVFCHEKESKQKFDTNNRNLYKDSTLANKYGNILMPTIMQLGNLQYVLIALEDICNHRFQHCYSRNDSCFFKSV